MSESATDGEQGITTSVETERKYDVDERTALPELPGAVADDAPAQLLAIYYDTADLALAAARTVLRRREGGHDAGWHLKTTVGGDRIEQHAALSDEAPPALLGLVQHLVGDATLQPIARIANERHIVRLLDAAGQAVVELADDHVTATDLRREVTTAWREWEAELLDAAPTAPAERELMLDEVEAALLAAGARPAASGSKLARTLGLDHLGGGADASGPDASGSGGGADASGAEAGDISTDDTAGSARA